MRLVNNSLKDYEALAKQMNDYYLPGIQQPLVTLDRGGAHRSDFRGNLRRGVYRTFAAEPDGKAGRQYLNKKLQDQPVTPEEKGIEEGLGTIWKSQRLEETRL